MSVLSKSSEYKLLPRSGEIIVLGRIATLEIAVDNVEAAYKVQSKSSEGERIADSLFQSLNNVPTIKPATNDSGIIDLNTARTKVDESYNNDEQSLAA